jgi:ABC-type nitrate/sulfonate/bicarbonate transport system permease component
VIRRVAPVALELVVPVGIVVAWWLVTADSTSPYWPPLQDIVEQFRRDWLFRLVPVHLVPSVERLAAGFAIGAALAVGLGVVLGLVALVRSALLPLLDFARAIPGAALIPCSLFLFGIGDWSKVSIVAWATFWPVLLNTIDGVRGVDSSVGDLAAAYRISRRDRLLHVVLPWASPQIFAGLRVAVAHSLLAVVVTEMFISTSGLGYYIANAQNLLRLREMWAGILVLMVVAWLMNLLFLACERRMLAWHRGWRAAALEEAVAPA